jgi:nucleolar protein 56
VTKSIAAAWDGAYLLDGARILAQRTAPTDALALAERIRIRAGGGKTPEETALLAERADETWSTRDRRLTGPGVLHDPWAPTVPGGAADPALRRAAVLRAAEEALDAAWDPSIHVEEATRAVRDLDRAANLVGERLSSWVARDTPDVDAGDAARAARVMLEGGSGNGRFSPNDPRLAEGRRRLAEAYRGLIETRGSLEEALAAAVPARMPNLDHLLGPDLAAKLLAQAGGLDRLARLPSSTVQVLGAERAFFEHLRGRAPPPRHGLLFLHPSIQSAPRSARGKLARTLAGKVSIAARLDQGHAPLDAALREGFERRERELKARRAAPPRARPGRRGSRPPLDAAPEDR